MNDFLLPLAEGEEDHEVVEEVARKLALAVNADLGAVRRSQRLSSPACHGAYSRRAPSPAEAKEELLSLRHATPQRILRAALGAFGDRIALVSSFGAESAVLLHMAAEIDRDIPVLFLDTGMLFAQTLDYRQDLARQLGLTDVRDLRPAFRDLALTDPTGALWKTDTDACCNLRKVAPLDQALGDFEAWITGRKRFQSATRASLPVWESTGDKVKVNPLANWSKADLDDYVAKHDLPAHPLVAQGFPSIGCWPCTKPVEEGHDAREGRWAGSEKTECGIHTPSAKVLNLSDKPFDNLGDGL